LFPFFKAVYISASSKGVRGSIKGSTREHREARGLSKGAKEAEHKGAESGRLIVLHPYSFN
jgi:hypothetical protein